MNMPGKDIARSSINRHLLWGLILVAVLVAGVGGWAETAEISGAVIAQGSLVVATSVKKVQHLTGGIVGEVRVHDGDPVEAGEIVVRLDDTNTRANLAITAKNLTEFSARKARLEAERDDLANIDFPRELRARLGEPDVAHIVAGERRLFELRRTARTGQKAQLLERIKQMKEELSGLEAQAKAKAQEIVLIQRELGGAHELWQKHLMPIAKLTELERAATRIEGERAQLTANAARNRGRISEIELQIIQIDRDFVSDVAKELRGVDDKIGEYVERKIAAEDLLKRIDIRAPQAGTVHESTVHTVGGVIAPGDVIMIIVPKADNLTAEVKVSPRDIDQLHLDQPAKIRFSAFNQRTTPEVTGKVTRIGADVTTDKHTGQNYYVVRIGLTAAELKRLGDVTLLPGMPVEAFIHTGNRKVISYLIKPLRDQIARAFREQ